MDVVRPTTPPPNFHAERALADVERLLALDPETLLYAHYGPAPAADRLEAYAETLTEWVDAVAAARGSGRRRAVAERFADAADTVDVWDRRRARRGGAERPGRAPVSRRARRRLARGGLTAARGVHGQTAGQKPGG
jgi:glyoxylase-like metal-dependent hydrolase (beta-lactamase superfamily II)